MRRALRILWIVPAVLLLSSCTTTQNPAASVTPESVQAYAAACSKTPDNNLTPRGYVIAGFDFVDQQCQAFFDGIVELQKDARYASSSIATANTQAAAIMGLVKASAGSIAVVAAGSELVRKLVEGYAAEYAFSPYALESRRVVNDALSLYRDNEKTKSAIEALTSSTGDQYCLAQNIVRNYAKICSLSGIEALTREAIANTKVSESKPTGSGALRVTVSERTLRPAGAPRAAGTKGGRPRSTRPTGLSLPNFVAGQ
jgi:hypothetical protein